MIFNKARDEKKTGGKPESPGKSQPTSRSGMEPTKSQPVSSFLFHYSRICIILAVFYSLGDLQIISCLGSLSFFDVDLELTLLWSIHLEFFYWDKNKA